MTCDDVKTMIEEDKKQSKKRKEKNQKHIEKQRKKDFVSDHFMFQWFVDEFSSKGIIDFFKHFFFCETTREEAIKTNKQTRMKHFLKLNQRFTNI